MYKLSPSDFAFLYQECKRCYYLKARLNLPRPWSPLPGVFSTMNSLVQTPMVGKQLNTISPALPEGTVIKQEGWVESDIVPGTSVFIKGKYDLLVEKSDGTYILVDLKISSPQEEKIDKYQSQLNAYHFALEHPKSAAPISVTSTGLLIFYPESFQLKDGTAIFTFPPTWLEVPIEEKGFVAFATEIDTLLSGPIPQPNPECSWCQYRQSGQPPEPSPDIPF